MNTCFTPDCAIWITELMSDLMGRGERKKKRKKERKKGTEKKKNPGKDAAPLLYTM